MNIGILGGNGFLGSTLVEYFLAMGNKVNSITRENYEQFKKNNFDLFINANGNSKKFWANQNPKEDFKASVESVKKSLEDFKFKKYVFISSSDVYPDHNDPKLSLENTYIDRSRLEVYGLHKLMAEDLVCQLPDYIILRCSAMVGPNLKKGVVKDILAGAELFVTPDSYLQFISTLEIGRAIERLAFLEFKNQIFNCGGKGALSPKQIGESLNLSLRFRFDAQKQEYEINVNKLDVLISLKTSNEYMNSLNIIKEKIYDNL